MIISKLTLKNYRSYSSCEIQFEKGINVIVGENGTGKTNLVEAIHYLSLTKAFRGVADNELVMHNTKQALVEAEISVGDVKKQIRVILSPDSKIVQINGKKVSRLSELSKVVNVIIFEPSDVLMFKDSPSTRRRFLDISISKQSPLYLQRLLIYEKLLKERNDILKQETIDYQHLQIVTEQLIRSAEPIVRERERYVAQLNKVLTEYLVPNIDSRYKLELEYRPFLKPSDNFVEKASLLFQQNKENDVRRKITTNGPHREDLIMKLNNKDISLYGSQGENRLAVLSLKIAPYYLIEEKELKPIVILDDVMSELDKEHQLKLIALLNNIQQVFITATDISIEKAHYYKVANHLISRRNS